MSCKKDTVDLLCQPMPDEPAGFGWNYISEANINCPCFNPNNDNEILYTSFIQGIGYIYRYNLVSGEKHLVTQGTLYASPQWGTNDWILLNFPDANIWKVKPNGDSLTNITQSRWNFYRPNWNLSATNIVAEPLDGPIVVLDLKGNIIDTLLHYPMVAAGWYIDDQHLVGSGDKIGIYSIPDDTFTPLSDVDLSTCSGGIPVNPDEFIWADKTGIYKTNRRSGTTRLLKSTCTSQLYLYPTVNKSRTKLLWAKTTTHPKGNDLHVSTKIVEMDLDGQNEKELNLP